MVNKNYWKKYGGTHGVSHPLCVVILKDILETDCPLVGPRCQTPPHYWGPLRPIFLRMDGPPCGSLACASFCTPRLKGAAKLGLHKIAHIGRWARFYTRLAPHQTAPFVVVPLAGAFFVLKPFWGRLLGPSPTFRNWAAPLNTPNSCQLMKKTEILFT